MAYSKNQPTVDLIASTTFATSDLHKFVGLTTDAEVGIGITTAAGVLGTLLSVTATTAGAGSEVVTVGLLQGIGKVTMAVSTRDAGQTVAASSAGLGIAPTTSKTALGTAITGSETTAAGRVFSVLFHTGSEELST